MRISGSESVAPLTQSRVAVCKDVSLNADVMHKSSYDITVGLLVIGACCVLDPVDEEILVLLQDQELSKDHVRLKNRGQSTGGPFRSVKTSR